jgi:hypothetical protein
MGAFVLEIAVRCVVDLPERVAEGGRPATGLAPLIAGAWCPDRGRLVCRVPGVWFWRVVLSGFDAEKRRQSAKNNVNGRAACKRSGGFRRTRDAVPLVSATVL